MHRIGLWGHDGGLDYWTALARGEVSGPEQRAVALLKRLVDPYRFSLYCVMGRLPVMGNVTKTIYLVQKGGGVVELEDGFGIASWCISIGPHSQDVPPTDQVVALRAIIEGEELAFFRTGNRGTGFMAKVGENPDIRSPFEEPFGPKTEYSMDMMIGTDQLLDPRPDAQEPAMMAPPVLQGYVDADAGGLMGDDMHGEYLALADRPRRRRRRRVYRRDDPGWFDEACYDAGVELGQDIGAAARRDVGHIQLGPLGQQMVGQGRIPVLRAAPGYGLMA